MSLDNDRPNLDAWHRACCDAGTPRTGMVDLVDVVPPRFHDEGRWREGLPWN